ncbi:MAG: sensor histidine kinase [Candidatus Rifleibacteriota bacterium]
MRTFYASPQRASAMELEKEIESVSKHPVINHLLESVSGIFAVCNQHRQIITVNETFSKIAGFENLSELIGLRPGEALNCIHSRKNESGCGTGKICRSCGAAVAMVLSLKENKPVEENCAVTVNSIKQPENYFFRFKSRPVKIKEKDYLFLTLQDRTQLQELKAIEKVFYHDMTNVVSAIAGLSEFGRQCEVNEIPEVLDTISNNSIRLIKEIKLQRLLSNQMPENYEAEKSAISLTDIFHASVDLLAGHEAVQGKKLRKPENLPDIKIYSDKFLLTKVLQNMLINAFENSDLGRAVRFWVDCENNLVTFCVWNHREIAEKMRLRIFQRNYTTKKGDGHGLGTYAIKVFGETFLGGKVEFESSDKSGTVFRLILPQGKTSL